MRLRRRPRRYCETHGERMRRRFGIPRQNEGRHDPRTGRDRAEGWYWACPYAFWPFRGCASTRPVSAPRHAEDPSRG